MQEELVFSGTLFTKHLDRLGKDGKGVRVQGQGYRLEVHGRVDFRPYLSQELLPFSLQRPLWQLTSPRPQSGMLGRGKKGWGIPRAWYNVARTPGCQGIWIIN